MSASKDQKNNAADREVVFSRLFDAPRAMVWDAWTDPAQLVQWWGPKGFTTTVQEYDLRTGGTWKFIMHGPDGTDYSNKSIFTQIIPNECIVFTHGGGKPGGPAAQFEMIATFEDEAGKTRLTMRLVFPTAEARDQNVRTYNSLEGGKQTLERLAGHLAAHRAASHIGVPGEQARRGDQHEIHITRVFNAPRALVWKAWTDSEQARLWAGPRGFTLMHANHDIRPGGKWRGCLHRDPDPGTDQPTLDLWQEGQYLEVVPPERLTFTFRWDNRDGQPTPETTVTITFEEYDGKTTMHFHQAFFKTAEDRDGHRGGWNSSFDRLNDHLAATTPKETQHA